MGCWLQPRSHGSTLRSPVSRSVSRLGEDPVNEDVLAHAELAEGDFRCSVCHFAIGQLVKSVFRFVLAVFVFSKSAFSNLIKCEIKRVFFNCSFRNVPREEEHGGALSMFFRSLLPSFYSQTADGQQRERLEMRLEQPVEGAEGGPRPLRDTELARGVENLMVAMRELLNTLSYRGQPGGEQGDDAGENEEEWEEGQENQ